MQLCRFSRLKASYDLCHFLFSLNLKACKIAYSFPFKMAKLHIFRQILVVQLSQIFLMSQLYIVLIYNGIVQCCVNAYMTK